MRSPYHSLLVLPVPSPFFNTLLIAGRRMKTFCIASLARFGLILVFFILASTVYAADPVIITDTLPDVNTNELKAPAHSDQNLSNNSDVDLAQLRKTVQQYEISIAELEKSGGAYDDRIGEEKISLGLAYKKLGQYKKAIETFNNSLHISRVNHGLASPDQLAILDLIIETNTARLDWEALEENYQYLYWVNRRIYEEHDPDQLLDSIQRIARWHLNAYLTGFDPIPYKHLLWTDKLFHDAVDIIEKNFGQNDPRLIEVLNGIAIANYYIAFHVFHTNTASEVNENKSSTLKMNRFDNVSDVLISQPDFYSRHERKKVLNRIVKISREIPALPAEDRARALVNLGDLYFIYDWRGYAFRNYAEAYNLLVDIKFGTDSINKLFGKPVRVPSIITEYLHAKYNMDSETEGHFVTLSFDVTARGYARKIKIIEESDPDNFMVRKQAREFIRSSLFRPKFTDGEPALAMNVIMKLSVKSPVSHLRPIPMLP